MFEGGVCFYVWGAGLCGVGMVAVTIVGGRVLALTVLSTLILSTRTRRPTGRLLPCRGPGLSTRTETGSLLSHLALRRGAGLVVSTSPTVSQLNVPRFR